MAILNPEQASSAQWDFLVSNFKTEQANGKRLTLVKAVSESLSLWTEFIPAVGVQLMDAREEFHATGKHKLYCDFVIQCSTQSTAASASAMYAATAVVSSVAAQRGGAIVPPTPFGTHRTLASAAPEAPQPVRERLCLCRCHR